MATVATILPFSDHIDLVVHALVLNGKMFCLAKSCHISRTRKGKDFQHPHFLIFRRG